METIKRRIDQILAFCCILLCGLLTVVVTWQVVARYLLNSPGAQSEELAKIMFVWLTLFSAALLFGEKGHMNIGILCDALPTRWNLSFQILTSVLILIFCFAILVVGGWDAVGRTMRQTNAAIPYLSTGQIYLALPICGVFSSFYCVYNIVTDFRRLAGTILGERPQQGG
ncbi:TRAP transporter, DctQ-like membrane protein [uncultured Pleomorphomonas sp.]|uniref:TRAP transporter small permease protein n=1 Tax=uncultured Pleomorphomonas sp. TaxID=442121 RepID=A0A212LGA5_9HYPH|nr:TRAP transporter small permease [uncultured Pleomorphomonas sp.]SCM76497.1 TRAP transporter, DctQ-like membrane protein [uncultured Pleomorphomonas sp.]